MIDEDIKIETKICSECNVEKNVNEFYFRKDANNYRKQCIDCFSLKQTPYKEKNKDEIYVYQRSYWGEHTEEKSIYLKDRRKKNPSCKLQQNISRSVNRILKREESSKVGESTLDYLPYTTEELKIHLESQFESWMSWDNYGAYKRGGERKWHIDHIIPQSLLQYDFMNTFNFQKCWALSNLMPLQASKNISKSSKISNELYIETMDKINLEFEFRAENDFEFKIKLEKWKLEEEITNQEQLKKVG